MEKEGRQVYKGVETMSETAGLVDRSTNGAAWMIIQPVRDNSTVKQRESEDDLHGENE